MKTENTGTMECIQADTCLSDYWSGHHLPHIQIPVWHGMTLAEIKRAIMTELSQGAVMGSTENARMLGADMVRPEEEKRADFITRKAYAAVNRMRPNVKHRRRFFLDLEPVTDDDDCSESVYAFFVFVGCE